jgi:eukaryotic-like serine/threonine-protein kinase
MRTIFPKLGFWTIILTLVLGTGLSGRGGSEECGAAGIGGTASIPAGCFNMGDGLSEKTRDELPAHKVCIRQDFTMDVHEVTNAQFQVCVEASGCSPPKTSRGYTRPSYYGNPTYANFPVIYVDWAQAAAYCSWAGKRLPTEAEWEYAARGGLDGQRYPRGNSLSCDGACFGRAKSVGACLNVGGLPNDTHPVGHYPPNGYGLYDMAGNVAEWVNDWYSSTYYQESPSTDPTGPEAGAFRVRRGGSWYGGAYYQRVSVRYEYASAGAADNIGFRCVAN